MSLVKTLVTACGLALSLAPLSGSAATAQDGFEACAEALMIQLADDGKVGTAYQVEPTAIPNYRLDRRETFHLDVKSRNGQETLARADCVVDRRGQVRAITDVPVFAEDAEKRASLY